MSEIPQPVKSQAGVKKAKGDLSEYNLDNYDDDDAEETGEADTARVIVLHQ